MYLRQLTTSLSSTETLPSKRRHHHWTWHDRLLGKKSFTSTRTRQRLKLPNQCPRQSRCITWRVLEISCPPTQPFSGSSNLPPARHWRAHPSHVALSPQFAADDLLTLQTADSSLRTMAAHIFDPLTHPISTSDLTTSSSTCSTLTSTCCILETVFSHMSLSHSLRQSS